MFKILPLFVLAVVVACCQALPVEPERMTVAILKSEMNKHNDGSYDTIYEAGDGTKRQEDAAVVSEGTEEEALEVKGSYTYIDDDGKVVEVFYTAGKNGFVPYGDTINPEITAVAEAAKDLPKPEKKEKFGQ
ncbi:endocuticle structural glycoprotein ABD-5-like [Drosophila rhopaloa]|uniref:Endocuticle structural glycoprotein ABD-5-like n=1 Tax=Drosophila rhopaloa TaxID=1041015 RepID=A0A6P4FWJ3_DRORH|nr:endocuticle structural glycoprotein ABD-5-like [Drosophila rhopaloa]